MILLLKEQPVEDSLSAPKRFEWQSVIREALEESDAEKLRAKIAEAESVIFRRLQSIGQDSSEDEERSALREASNTLLTLKREVLKFPDWRS
jgi:hypothetical protein